MPGRGKTGATPRSLRSKLALILAVSLLPVGILSALQAVVYEPAAERGVEDTLPHAMLVSARQERNALRFAQEMLRAVAAVPAVADREAERCDEVLAAVHRRQRRYEVLAATDRAGNLVCSATPLGGAVNLTNQPWFGNVMRRTQRKLTGPIYDLVPGRGLLLTGLATRDSRGRFNGYIIAGLGERWFDVLLEASAKGAHTQVALIDGQGRFIADAATASAGAAAWLPPAATIEHHLGPEPAAFRTEEAGGEEDLFALAPIIDREVFMIVRSPTASDEGAALAMAGGIAVPVLMWMIAVGVVWLSVNRLVVRPVHRLNRMAEALTAGRRSLPSASLANAPAEFQHLGATMDKMAAAIHAQESDLKRALKEQHALLQEVHHRVKNNLQIVASLLNLQLQRPGARGEQRALRTTQDRIQALAMIHGTLYQSGNLSQLRLDRFLLELLDYLWQAHGREAVATQLQSDLEPVTADAFHAIPVALLVTEAVTNAFKHAWPHGGPRTMRVTLKHQDGERVRLSIADDGCGDHDAEEAGTAGAGLGTRLIGALVDQLDGALEIERDGGYRVIATFPLAVRE
jgi:two-component sensor histidine kinase